MDNIFKVAFIGHPNAGKSSVINYFMSKNKKGIQEVGIKSGLTQKDKGFLDDGFYFGIPETRKCLKIFDTVGIDNDMNCISKNYNLYILMISENSHIKKYALIEKYLIENNKKFKYCISKSDNDEEYDELKKELKYYDYLSISVNAADITELQLYLIDQIILFRKQFVTDYNKHILDMFIEINKKIKITRGIFNFSIVLVIGSYIGTIITGGLAAPILLTSVIPFIYNINKISDKKELVNNMTIHYEQNSEGVFKIQFGDYTFIKTINLIVKLGDKLIMDDKYYYGWEEKQEIF